VVGWLRKAQDFPAGNGRERDVCPWMSLSLAETATPYVKGALQHLPCCSAPKCRKALENLAGSRCLLWLARASETPMMEGCCLVEK